MTVLEWPTGARLYAGIHPTGRWDEPCDVRCDCGYHRRCPNWEAAQAEAWRHDHDAHWGDGMIPTETQLVLPL